MKDRIQQIKDNNKKVRAINKRNDKKLMDLGLINYPISQTKEA